jgi:hypothetical protein
MDAEQADRGSHGRSLARCAAYVAARGALDTITRTSRRWPELMAIEARIAALEMVRAVVDGLGCEVESARRRRCARDAMASALRVAALCDVARATGVDDVALEEAARATSRAVSVLALFFHASAG